jgi:hypothetical protein
MCEALRALAREAAALIVERRGIEDGQPRRWKAIDLRLAAIEAEAGQYRPESPEGMLLQACIGAGDATGADASACLSQLSRALEIPALAPLVAFYVGKEAPTHERPLP